ncbi:hypothetical protein [Virgibacillus chiguensis]|uniref:Sporulation lipoprotein YhcN/YlaJ (Spore_YhcN_YlaJ) n=1 Tax=Virgibacillus chiguensis TaxID=411959 RepID=A0A1M5NMR9_9BACI|nr:hypothetical protein [Virgibacillus chiguensis]SHG90802.1 hypothetical protein SAMN05421807_102282 [Virgibacillus chiguensis]
MHVFKFLTIVVLSLLIVGCNTANTLETSKENEKDEVNITKISRNQSIDQTPSNQAKDLLQQHSEINAIHAVNTDKQLLATVEVKHMQRFKLQNIKKKLTKKLQKNFPDLKVELSADKKIMMELGKLEKNLNKKQYSKKEVQKEVQRIIDFSKEQT